MKAAIYSRKSKFTGKGESIENQIQLCRQYGMKYQGIAEEDFIIYEDEGFSGGNTKRPQFQKMMRDAKDKRFKMMICYRLDRISRNVSDFSNLIKDLNRYNVDFISLREQFDTTTPMGRAMMYIASVFSQLERETIAERITDNMIELAKTGRWLGGILPTGFESETLINVDDLGKERKMFKLSPIEEEINVVKCIYNKYVEFKSITKLQKYLVINNFTTKNGKVFERYSLRFILSNPVYAVADKKTYDYLSNCGYEIYSDINKFNGINGLMVYNKTCQSKELNTKRSRDFSEWIVSVGKHKGIISSTLWIEAQNLLSQNKSKSYRKVKSTNSLLSGVLRCSNCGSFMRPKAMQRVNLDGEQVFYYICEMKEKSKKTRCDIPNINGNILDKLVLNEVKKIISENPPNFDDIKDNHELLQIIKDPMETEEDSLKKKLAELDLTIMNLLSSIEKAPPDNILFLLYKRIEEHSKEKDAINNRLLEINNIKKNIDFSDSDMEQLIKDFSSLSHNTWDIMDVNTKRNMIKSLIYKILWDGEKIDIYVSAV